MNARYLYRAKKIDTDEWVEGFLKRYPTGEWEIERKCDNPPDCDPMWQRVLITYKIDATTICQCTGLKDKQGKLIWENDILMCHGNRNDLVKAVFGEFCVIDAETLEKIDRVIGWHYEVVQTDGISKCEPFCLSMPLTEEYVKRCEMEVVDNAELLEVMQNGL